MLYCFSSDVYEEATMVGNKKVMCNICYREMRSDNLKRHMKNHADLSSEDQEQICKSILESLILKKHQYTNVQ